MGRRLSGAGAARPGTRGLAPPGGGAASKSAVLGQFDPSTSLIGADLVDLPRLQAGFPPQHLLLTLVGDYGLGEAAAAPSAALVDLLADFGVTAVGARAALSRLARRELLVPTRSGRHTYYRMSALCRSMLDVGRFRTVSFTGALQEWDGRWTLVGFSVTEEHRALRPLLRGRLRWLGFAPLYDGLWVSPHAPDARLDAALSGLEPLLVTVVRGETVPGSQRRGPLDAWELDPLRAEYDAFLAEYRPVATQLRRRRLRPVEALVERTRLTYRWFALSNADPSLPLRLLPSRWPSPSARALFLELFDGLAPLAEQRVAELLRAHGAEASAPVRSVRSVDVLA